ncbi:MAG: bifunctional 2-polyprenyl-6-hydroxyphenol methylase/3-demethylubiquinol 3-O-methyltransferase UbiG [Saezia sp.]
MNSKKNVDEKEISKFDELAHHWWDIKGEFQALHTINPLRLGWIDSQAQIKGKKVLDVGCGGGILSDSMARAGAQVLGIDMSEKALQAAMLHMLEHQTPMLNYKQITVEELAAEQPAQYDVVTCMEMLEHVPNPESIVKAIGKLLKPGGWAFFATINKNLKAKALLILGAEYMFNLIPKGTHDYERFIRPADLATMGRLAGLELIAQSGLQYNPLTHTARLNADVSVNYMQAYQRT